MTAETGISVVVVNNRKSGVKCRTSRYVKTKTDPAALNVGTNAESHFL